MLYISTRNKADSITAHRILHQQDSPNGGYYMPFQLPVYSKEQMQQALKNSFNENLAMVLNSFFGTELNGWGLECRIGRNPVEVVSAGQKVFLAELWHNPANSYKFLQNELYCCLANQPGTPNSWVKAAIEIAVLFGIFAKIGIKENETLDIAVNSDDFNTTFSTFLARQMGLPVGNIICCFQENSDGWNFIHHGEISTALSAPDSLERFIYAALGAAESHKYLEAVERKGNYTISEDQHGLISQGMFPAVVGLYRSQFLADKAYVSNGICLDEPAATAYGGLQDYRSRTGESRSTLMLSYTKPKE